MGMYGISRNPASRPYPDDGTYPWDWRHFSERISEFGINNEGIDQIENQGGSESTCIRALLYKYWQVWKLEAGHNVTCNCAEG